MTYVGFHSVIPCKKYTLYEILYDERSSPCFRVTNDDPIQTEGYLRYAGLVVTPRDLGWAYSLYGLRQISTVLDSNVLPFYALCLTILLSHPTPITRRVRTLGCSAINCAVATTYSLYSIIMSVHKNARSLPHSFWFLVPLTAPMKKMLGVRRIDSRVD
jgi:hypothetical protein